MTISNRVYISDILATNLVTRSSVEKLFRLIAKKKSKIIHVDFSKVEFISRSFAHEYLIKKQDASKTVKEDHMNREVKKMLTLVSEQKDATAYSSVSIINSNSIPLSAKDLR